MNKYEIMFIVTADIEENSIKEKVKTFEKILTDKKAKIEHSKSMGIQKLAYPIKEKVRGYYHLLNVEAPVEAINEFERKALIDEEILRHLIIKDGE